MTAIGAIAIRPYRLSDVRAVYEAAMESVQRVEPFMPWCHPGLTESEQRAWIEAQVTAFQTRTAFEFAIVGYAERYLGGCGLNQFDVLNRRANWGLLGSHECGPERRRDCGSTTPRFMGLGKHGPGTLRSRGCNN